MATAHPTTPYQPSMNLLVSGYYGFGNAGDEWILEAFLQTLSPTSHTLTVLSVDPVVTHARHCVAAVDRWNPIALARALRDCDVFLSGGGGLIQDLSGPWSPAYYLALIAWARLWGKRVYLAGQGFGPLRRNLNRWLCRRVLPGAEKVMPRDAPGVTWCRENGVAAERLTLGADWVWSLPVMRPHPGRDWAVCLRSDGLAAGQPGWFADFLRLARAQRRRVRFLVLGNGGDRECLRALPGKAVAEKDIIDLREASWAQAVAALKGVGWVLSMRYHGLILGASAGAAVAGWGDDPKLTHLLQELQAPNLGDLKKAKALATMLACGAALRRAQGARVRQLRQRARKMAEALKRHLGCGDGFFEKKPRGKRP
ncbi:MAG: polysaccharide pyruvyl transferase CsaB [Candidatus Firestonebacteria bacterium]|nr:polysaccharide pyruvyl transferase CsaB [Candidatus Firestonebacteria bacterium]